MSTGAVLPRKNRIRPPTLSVSSHVLEKEKSSPCELLKVSPQLYISGYEAAKNSRLLENESITHILNLAGESKCPNNFSSSFNYFSLKMPDNPKIDILFFLYFAIEFMIDSIKTKGKVLVHCVKGTSRAAAVAIAYLILQGYSEQEAYSCLNNVHPCIDPNFGFVCQLKEFMSFKQEQREFHYNEKYGMFVNCESKIGSSIIIVGNCCVLYLDLDSPQHEQDVALNCFHLWEKFNQGPASIVYL